MEAGYVDSLQNTARETWYWLQHVRIWKDVRRDVVGSCWCFLVYVGYGGSRALDRSCLHRFPRFLRICPWRWYFHFRARTKLARLVTISASSETPPRIPLLDSMYAQAGLRVYTVSHRIEIFYSVVCLIVAHHYGSSSSSSAQITLYYFYTLINTLFTAPRCRNQTPLVRRPTLQSNINRPRATHQLSQTPTKTSARARALNRGAHADDGKTSEGRATCHL